MSRGVLTAKQTLFVEEYLVDLNATQAAARAGYSVQTINKQGPRLLKSPSVRAAIDAALKERSRRNGVKADDVLMEIVRIALHRITVGLGRAYHRDINMHSKQKALDQLARHLGPYGDQVQRLCVDYLMASLGAAKKPADSAPQPVAAEPAPHNAVVSEGDGCDRKCADIFPQMPVFAVDDYDPLSDNSIECYESLAI